MAADKLDRRVVSEARVRLIRAAQAHNDCALGGGAALSGAYLAHRLSRDVDLVCRSANDVRAVARDLDAIAEESNSSIRVVQDAGGFVRAQVESEADRFELDITYEPTPDVAPRETVEGIAVVSLADLRAAKLTCILSRSEPRDLVDLLFLDREGFPPEQDLALALQKDGGVDPGVLAWLLGDFPTSPLPEMLKPLAPDELRAFRDELRDRMRGVAVPEEGS